MFESNVASKETENNYLYHVSDLEHLIIELANSRKWVF